MSEPVRLDTLIRRLLPQLELPDPMRPADLLDEAVEPPAQVAEAVHALRQLVRSGGCDRPLLGTVATSEDIARHFRPRLAADLHESLWVCGLDARGQARLIQCVGRGGLSGVVIEPRDLLRPLVLHAISGVVLVHNHPSGDPTPSPEDVQWTARVARACELLGIRLLDHVIVGADGHVSFLDQGLLPPG